MATITTAGSGNWSSTTPNAPWPSGTVPTSADDVVIANTHAVTLDTVSAVALSLTINSGGILVASTTASSTLTLQLGATNNGTLTLDMSSVPQYSTSLLMNNSNNATSLGLIHGGSANFTLKGAAKKSWTEISAAMSAGATSCTVDDATGWRNGDRLIFATTGAYNATPYTDTVTGITVSGTSISWTGGTTNAHQDTCPVANMTRNVQIGGAASNYKSFMRVPAQSGSPTRVIQDVQFINMTGGYTSYPNESLEITGTNTALAAISNCSFENCPNVVGGYQYSGKPLPVSYCVFYNARLANTQCSQDLYPEDCLFLYATGTAFAPAVPNSAAKRNLYSGVTSSVVNTTSFEFNLADSEVWGCASVVSGSYGYWTSGQIDNCTIGTRFGSACSTAFNGVSYPFKFKVTDCVMQSSNLFATSGYDFTRLEIVNKNDDPGVQEIYTRHSASVPAVQRTTTTKTRSTSSIEMTMNYTGAVEHSFDVLAKSGETITLIGYARKNSSYGSSTLPKITVSGLGIPPVTATMSAGTAADTWEKLTLDATNSTGSDGLLTVTMTAQSATAGAKAYFSGLPVAPFVSRCRHYGYNFDETIPTRTVDAYVAASESTAAAYTGATINAGTKRVTFGAGTIDTFQKFYDYSRAWGVADVSLEIPLSRAGTACLLTSGWTIVDPVLTDCTWSGGNIEFTATGSKSGSFDSCDWTFTAAGTFNFATAVLAGTIELINTSGGAVTVQLPAGASYTNTGPDITVEVAVEQADALISGIVAGSRLQIYNVTTATEMVNAINATTSYTASYDNGTGYTAGDIVRVRLTWCDGLDAKLPAEYFTIATAAGWSVLADQEADEVYIANGIDGSTVTEYSSDYVNVQIDISDPDGTTSIQRGYAWYCDQMTGDDGIRYFFGAFVAEDAFNYLLDTDVADINIQNTGSSGVTLTGGAVRRKDGSSPIAPGGSVYIYYGRTYALETGVSGLTPSESNALNSAASKISTVEKIQRNKMITDPSTGVLTVFDDDGVTPLLTANIFKDAAGATPYDGTGAERRERLA